MDKNLVLISGSILYKEESGKIQFFLVKEQEDGGWEFPKVVVRKGESSVRAALRIMGEKGGMTTKVLEEAGRAGGVTTSGGNTFPQRHLYYLMVLKSKSEEEIGFSETLWLDYSATMKKLYSKREKTMLKAAWGILKEIKKRRKKRKKLKKV